MKRSLVLVLLGLLVISSTTLADEVRGRIVRYDPDKKELILQGRGRDRFMQFRFALDDKTEVLCAGEAGTAADLPASAPARVLFDEEDGKAIARVIRVPRALASRRPAAPGAPATPAPSPDTVVGALQRISRFDREIVVMSGSQGETTIAVPKETPIKRDGKEVRLDDLKEGEQVTVQTMRKDSQLTARSIVIGAGGAEESGSTEQVRKDLVPKVRRALQIADMILRQIEEAQKQRK